jgi:hypothetical protein
VSLEARQRGSWGEQETEDMISAPSFVERVRPLLIDRKLGEQLYMVAILESRSGERYRQWAADAVDAEVARGLEECAAREDAIAKLVRERFAAVLEEPEDLPALGGAIAKEVAAVFDGRTRKEQYRIQAEAERGGEQLWTDLAAAESDAATKAVLTRCAELEVASARFLEALAD